MLLLLFSSAGDEKAKYLNLFSSSLALLTLSRITPADNVTNAKIIIPVLRMAVGNLGTNPVSIQVEKMGIDNMIDVNENNKKNIP